MTTSIRVKFDEDGLVPAVAQDRKTGDVLMLAWMNAESLRLTQETRFATYWSRSRSELWKKGETSGNLQKVVEIKADCDGDALLLIVEQLGSGNACHEDVRSCFHNDFEPLEN